MLNRISVSYFIDVSLDWVQKPRQYRTVNVLVPSLGYHHRLLCIVVTCERERIIGKGRRNGLFLPQKKNAVDCVEPPPGQHLPGGYTRSAQNGLPQFQLDDFLTLFIVHLLTIFFFSFSFRFVNRPDIYNKTRRVITRTETLEIGRTEAGEVSGSCVRVVDTAATVFARIGSAVSAH